MSENITIQEGGTNFQFTAAKLRTDKVGGGTCLWVPEDEVALGTKSITANGTYKASNDGKYGYSQVNVNVPGGNGCADSSGNPISSGGEPTIGSSVIGIDPTDGETYEYSVDSNGDVTKTPAPTVEPSGAGSSIIGIDQTDGETYEYSVDSQGGVTKTLLPTVTPGGPGSGVVGTDPEDGNDYFIGIDETGSIVKTKIPSGISIGKRPDKTDYVNGEQIDYSGIIVILQGGDSAVFANTDYPNGRVPNQELIFPITTAPNAVVQNSDVEGVSFIEFGSGERDFHSIAYSSGGYEHFHAFVTFLGGRACIDKYGEVIVVSPNGPAILGDYYIINQYGVMKEWNYSLPAVTNNQVVLNGQMYYVSYYANGVSNNLVDDFGIPKLDITSNNAQFWASAFYGSSSSGNGNIPVKWKSPYDGRTFENTFIITVMSSTTSGSGYSDDSGGSSSGGGTTF